MYSMTYDELQSEKNAHENSAQNFRIFMEKQKLILLSYAEKDTSQFTLEQQEDHEIEIFTREELIKWASIEIDVAIVTAERIEVKLADLLGLVRTHGNCNQLNWNCNNITIFEIELHIKIIKLFSFRSTS